MDVDFTPFALRDYCTDAIELAQHAMRTAGQPGGALVARYLSEVAELPSLLAVGAFHRDTLVGFLVGWPCSARPWWSDHVRPALAAAGNEGWLDDAFEVAELHVHPKVQGAGVGTTLLHETTARITQPRIVLSTNAENNRVARSFYRARGFEVLTGPFRWLGTDMRVLVLGRNR